jgi:hypothetical protein
MSPRNSISRRHIFKGIYILLLITAVSHLAIDTNNQSSFLSSTIAYITNSNTKSEGGRRKREMTNHTNTMSSKVVSKESESIGNTCLALRGSNGRWVQDWQYTNRSKYPNHGSYTTWHIADQNFTSTPEQPFRLATSWRWEDAKCPVMEVSLKGFCQSCYDLGITRVLIVGDSLSIQFAQSLQSLLGFPPIGRRAGFNGRFTPFSMPCQMKHSSFEITFLLSRISPLSDLIALSKESNTTAPTPQRRFVESNPNRTAIVANTGSWLHSMEDYKQGFDSLISWIDSFDQSKIFAFYRETIPGHLGCIPAGEKEEVSNFDWINPVQVEPYANYRDYLNNTTALELRRNNGTVDYNWGLFEDYNVYSRSKLADRLPTKVKFHWLNVYNSTILRRDGHVGFGDCLHYYMPGPTDWWAHFFYSALLDLST